MTQVKILIPSKRACLFIYFLSIFFVSNGQVTSDFSVNNDGWTVFNTSFGSSAAAVYNATGGNPNGYISFTTTSGSLSYYWTAPSKFNGNLSRAYNQNLTFDMLQSIAGADNSINDIAITGAGVTVVYQLPSKPGTSWTSYSVKLNETVVGWHLGNLIGAAPSQTQMKQALSNITTFQIRMKYNNTAASYTGQLDNVVMNLSSIPSGPSISSFTPASGLPGTTVTINGTNFNPTAAQNAVYFNGVKGTVLTASATQLTVTSPSKIAYGQITVINLSNATQATSNQNFNPLFDNNKDFGGRIIPSSFATKVDFGTSTTEVGFSVGDLDGDGWTDVLTSGTSLKASVFRNLNQAGVVSSSSFAAPLVLSMPNSPATGATVQRVGQNSIADMDGDGKLDLVVNVGYGSVNWDNSFIIFLNQSTPGNLSFSSGTVFQFNTVNNNNEGIAIADMDGDGRPELMGALNNSACALGIAQNLSTPGVLDFAAIQNFGAAGVTLGANISYGDLNGDGKPEILIEAYLGGSIYMYENTSTLGTIAMGTPFQISTVTTSNIEVVDMDNDGKSDIVFKDEALPSLIHIKKNNHASGALLVTDFSADITLSSYYNSSYNEAFLTTADVNGDNKVDIVTNDGANVLVYQNNFTSGVLSSASFFPGITFEATNSYNKYILCADVDGDNKPEILIQPQSGVAPDANFRILHNESFQPQQLTSVNPASAASGSTVTVTGNYLNTHGDTPQVLSDAILSTPTNLSTTSFQFTVPNGFADNRIAATFHGLTGFSSKQFFTQLNGGTGGAINSSTFGASVDYLLTSTTANDGLTVADFDRDGKPDILVNDSNTGKIYANTLASAGGSIVPGTFTISASTISQVSHLKAADLDGDGIQDIVADDFIFPGTGTTPGAISFGTTINGLVNNVKRILVNHDFNLDGKAEVVAVSASNQIAIYENFTRRAAFTYSGNFSSLSTTPITVATGGIVVGLTAADFDGDGFDDIAYGVNTTTAVLTILRNTGLKQIIAAAQFASPVTFGCGLNPQYITTADFDGDGKLDIALANTGSAFVSVYLNTSTPGAISFTRQDITSPLGANGIDVGDIDGDGKPEIITINNPSGTIGSFSVFRNTSSVGTISFSSAVTFTIPNIPFSLAIADVNLDNKADVILARNGTTKATLSVFQNLISFPTINITSQPTSVYVVCDGATPTISTTATGTTNIAYQWQFSPDGIAPFTNLTNTGGYSNVSTSSFTINTTGNFGTGIYRCKITGDFASPVYTNTVSFTVDLVPGAPSASNVSNCGSGAVTLTASGGTNGNYLWYDVNGLIAGQNNNTYTTPIISSTTQYSVAITNGTCTSSPVNVSAIINTAPSAPTASNVSNCGSGSLTLTASGGTNGNYLWYDINGLIAGQNNNTYTTPIISSTSQYSVAITNGTCTSSPVNVSAIINSVPASPSVQDASGCTGTSLTLSASGGTNGQYVWYTTPTGGTAIPGEVNGTYVTPVLSTTTIYYVSINNGSCESARVAVTATVGTSGCSAPVIATKSLATQIGGTITLNLLQLITTSNSNLDTTSLKIVVPPSSGAKASISPLGVLTIDYTGISFSGAEQISIQACDKNENCTTQQFSIDVAGDIVVYNGISPNGKNPSFFLEYINILPDTKNNSVYIFDRWENQVWHGTNYDNASVVFTGVSDGGSDLPSGVYFYKIDFASGRKSQTGFLSLRRQ